MALVSPDFDQSVAKTSLSPRSILSIGTMPWYCQQSVPGAPGQSSCLRRARHVGQQRVNALLPLVPLRVEFNGRRKSQRPRHGGNHITQRPQLCLAVSLAHKDATINRWTGASRTWRAGQATARAGRGPTGACTAGMGGASRARTRTLVQSDGSGVRSAPCSATHCCSSTSMPRSRPVPLTSTGARKKKISTRCHTLCSVPSSAACAQ